MARKDYHGRIGEVYFDSVEQKNKFFGLAAVRGCTFSRYAINILEEAVNHEQPALPATDYGHLEDENRELRRRIAELSREIETINAELQRQRYAAFNEDTGINIQFDPDLLAILQAGPIHSHALLTALKINPSDTTRMRALAQQLEILESTRFIAKSKNGWRWLK